MKKIIMNSIRVVLSLFVISFSGCKKSPEDARKELMSLGYEYTPEKFIESVNRADTTAVKLFFLAGINPNVEYPYSGETALWHTIENNDYNMAKFLLDNGAKPNKNAVFWASSRRRSNFYELLLDRGADVNAAVDAEWTIGYGNKESLKILWAKGKGKFMPNTLLVMSLLMNDETSLQSAINNGAWIEKRMIDNMYRYSPETCNIIDRYRNKIIQK